MSRITIGADTAVRIGAVWLFPDTSSSRAGIRVPTILGNGDPGIATPGFVGRPARPDPIIGRIQGNDLIQYDFTPQQYDALGKLAAALHEVLPRIRLEAPRGPEGQVIPNALSPSQLENHSGLLGHYHVQPNKVDPGPAFNWEHLLALARKNARR